MDTRTIIGEYLAKTFLKLYETKYDAVSFFTGSLKSETNYFRLLDTIISDPKPVRIDCGNYVFPLFYCSSNRDSQDISGLTMEELLVNAFMLQSGWQEIVLKTRDNHGRFPFRESLQSKFQFNLIPVVNLIYREICLRINATGNSCVPLKFSATGSNIVFSHDIDRLHSGWFESTGNLVKKPGPGKVIPWLKVSYNKFFKGIDDYEAGFDRSLQLLDKWGIKSVYFFLAERSKEDADYSLDEEFVRRAVDKLLDKGHLIGIHAGFFTFRNDALLKEQVRKAEDAFGKKIIHNRQHFLKFDLEKTPEVLVHSGIKYDYSLGFPESACLRNSICTPFYLFDFSSFRSTDLVEIPLLFMDGTYSHYMKVTGEQMVNPLVDLVINAQGINLNVSVLFHNTVFTDFKYKGFTGLFESMAGFCVEMGFSTEAQVSWPRHL